MKIFAIIMGFGVLLGIMIWDGGKQVALLNQCKQQRIVPLNPDHFTWEGINKLAAKGEYQPKCL
ncbi:MAG: hypothetical protein WCV93_05025 [Candidatus Shapirobacteria bacterium]|jgi:hypothetical protein